jgi:hypothetical protein
MVRTGRSAPDAAEVEHSVQIEEEEMERLRAAQDTVRTGREEDVSPSTSMTQTTTLTHDLQGEGSAPLGLSTPEVAREFIATVAGETNNEIVDTEELREGDRVGGRRGDKPFWQLLVERDELMKETELDKHDAKWMKTLNVEMDCDKEGTTVDSDRDGKGSTTSATSIHKLDLEQMATRHDLECRQNRVATVPDDESHPSNRPGSPTKSKKLKKEPAVPPPRARSRSNSRYKL